LAERYKLPLQCITWPTHEGSLPPQGRFLTVNEPFVLQTVKTAEDGQGTVVRLLNPNEWEGTVEIGFHLPCKSAWFSDFKETRATPLLMGSDGHVSFSLRGKGVATVVFGE